MMEEVLCKDCALSFQYPPQLKRHKGSRLHKKHAGRLQSVITYEVEQDEYAYYAICITNALHYALT